MLWLFKGKKKFGILKNFNKKEYKDRRMEKATKKSDHTGKRGHVRDECFKLKGAPEWFENLQTESTNIRQVANVVREQGSYEENIPLDG